MKKILLFPLITAFVFLFNAKSDAQLPQGIYKILGVWETVSEGMTNYERWDINPDSSLKGFDFVIGTKGDTAVFEKLEIIKKGDNVYYVATVEGQNGGKAIYFQMIEWTRNVFVFENKEHDFPQRIMYYIKNDNQFNAVIEGPDKDKIKSIEFIFYRK